MQVCAVHWQSVINSFRGTGCTCADCTSMYLRVYGASVCVITDPRALSRKSSTVTILETLFIHFHSSKASISISELYYPKASRGSEVRSWRLLKHSYSVLLDLLLDDDTFLDKELLTTPEDIALLCLMKNSKKIKSLSNFLATFVRSTNDALTCLLSLTFVKI